MAILGHCIASTLSVLEHRLLEGRGSVFFFLVLALAECLTHDNTKEISVQGRDQYDNFYEKKN